MQCRLPFSRSTSIFLFPNDLQDDSFRSPAIPLPVEDSLPRSQVQLPSRDRHDHFVTQRQVAQVGCAVVFTGEIVQVVVAAGGVIGRAMVDVTVNPVVDILDDTTSTSEDTPVTLNVHPNKPCEDAWRTVTGVTNGANGTVVIVDAALGTVRYTPNADFNGPDSFTYTVTPPAVTV